MTRDSRAVTQGKVNAVPNGISATATASMPRFRDNGIPSNTRCQQHEPQAREFRLSQPIDHASQQQHPGENGDGADVHEEIANRLFRDLKARVQE